MIKNLLKPEFLLKNSQRIMINYEIAKNELISGNIKSCEKFFKSNGYLLEYGYCLLLKGKLSDAEKFLKKSDSLRADWAIKLISFMRGYVEVLPTYFQIRNFLEIDINLLIMYKQTESIQYILGGADLMYSVNKETYKFIARVMMNNGYYDVSKKYLDKYKDDTYNDPELHFMYALYYISLEDYDKAIISVDNCLGVLPEYYPAKQMKLWLNNINKSSD